MNKQKKGKVRFVYQSSPPLLKCVVLVMILVSVAALVVLGDAIADSKARQDALQMEAAQLEEQNRRLTQEIAELGTVESVKRIASLKLGLVDPNDQFFNPN